MKRGEPLKRLTRLTVKKPMSRGKGLKAAGSELKRAAAKKPKRARRTGPPAAVMALLAQRSGGWCELGIVCLGNAQATDPSHRIAKGMGGTRDPRSNTAANNLAACRQCHDLAERSPAESYANGWKIRRGAANPADVPVRHWVHGWVYLDEAGGWRSALEYAPEGES